MKLIIQIPCHNEEGTLPQTLRDLPRSIPGIETIEILVIEDGSTDRTAEAARANGAHHIIRLTSHRGLAAAFAEGLNAALQQGADIIVNTDADNQYSGADIAHLVQPILQQKADIVVGCRDIEHLEHFSPMKKVLQRLGSAGLRLVSRTDIPDATSGFRAYSREAALRLNVFSSFTYTLETLIQAGAHGLTVAHVPVATNAQLRESRLFHSLGEYVLRSFLTLIQIYTMYRPLRVFTIAGGALFSTGLMLGLRFLYFYFALGRHPTGHIQSLILAAVCMIIGLQIVMFGLVADLTAKNRKMLEELLLRIKRTELRENEPREQERAPSVR